MLREALLIMITLLTSCWSYSPSTNSYSAIRLRIDRSHSNKILTHRGKLCMSCNDDMLLQSLNYLRSIDDRQLSRPTRFVYIKKPVLASLVGITKWDLDTSSELFACKNVILRKLRQQCDTYIQIYLIHISFMRRWRSTVLIKAHVFTVVQ